MNHLISIKQDIKKGILSFLYDPADKKMSAKFDLIANNFSIDSKYRAPAFMYKGQIYCSEGFRPVRGQKVELLSRRLYDQMDKWTVETEELKQERLNLDNFLSCALIASNSANELKELLPSCVHTAIPTVDTYNAPTQLKYEDIQLFHYSHKNHIQTIKERVVLNMVI